MSTILYSSPIFGPIHSRRLGLSLGINLMPPDGKVCTFDCIYCECGYNKDHRPHSKRPTREEVATALKQTLEKMTQKNHLPDVLTFAGNGEPTSHPDFYNIIIDTLELRDTFCPEAKVSVLSNATLINRPEIFNALKLVDNNILKLDTVNIDYIKKINQPILWYNVNEQIKYMKKFKGHCIIQTMFMKNVINGEILSNTTPEYVTPWLKAIKKIKPQQVMIYTIDRETPDKNLLKATREELDSIVEQINTLGIPASAAY